MSIGNGAPAWPSVIVSNDGISPSDHTGRRTYVDMSIRYMMRIEKWVRLLVYRLLMTLRQPARVDGCVETPC